MEGKQETLAVRRSRGSVHQESGKRGEGLRLPGVEVGRPDRIGAAEEDPLPIAGEGGNGLVPTFVPRNVADGALLEICQAEVGRLFSLADTVEHPPAIVRGDGV